MLASKSATSWASRRSFPVTRSIRSGLGETISLMPLTRRDGTRRDTRCRATGSSRFRGHGRDCRNEHQELRPTAINSGSQLHRLAKPAAIGPDTPCPGRYNGLPSTKDWGYGASVKAALADAVQTFNTDWAADLAILCHNNPGVTLYGLDVHSLFNEMLNGTYPGLRS